MELPVNRFKTALAEGRHQLGIWHSLGGRIAPDLLAACGFDWVLLDCEHAPLALTEVLPALQAIAAWPGTTAIVRPPSFDVVAIKRLLDMGAQTLLLPYIETPEEAAAAVAATRYPPEGVRGVAGFNRGARYGLVPDYATRAADELCLLLQVETRRGLDHLEAIATTPGVDGVFIGPADLAASLGHPGGLSHPEVVDAILGAIDRLRAVNVPAGILSLDPGFAQTCVDRGTLFTAVGADLALLRDAALGLRRQFPG